MRSGNPQTVQYLWAGAAVCGTVALWALYKFLLSLRRDRLLEDTPLVKIRSAAQGYVKLFGRAAAAGDGALAAPLSSRPCVWWRYVVEERTRTAKGETRWESIDSGTSIDLFVLADADAQCLVGPVNAEITPSTHDVWYGAAVRPGGPPPRIGSLSGNFRYTESLLSMGAQVSVCGELRSHSEGGSTDAAASVLLKQWKQDQKTLLARFDQNHDGRIDANEWDAARQAAIKEAQTQNLITPIARMSVISQPANGEPFLIAPMDDAHLVRREKRRAALFLCLGLLCVVLCAWAIEHAHALAAAATGSNNGFGAMLPMALWGLAVGFGGILPRLLRKFASK